MATTDVRTTLYDNLTYEDYFDLPEMRLRYDIVDGRLILLPSPELQHQLCLVRILRVLDDHATLLGIGLAVPAPFDVLIRREPRLQCRQPDVLYVSFARLGVASRSELRGRKVLPLEVPPELAVEILSDNNRPSDVLEKLTDYAFIGVDEVWILDPENPSLEVLCLDGARYLRADLYTESDEIRSRVLPELRLALRSIFED